MKSYGLALAVRLAYELELINFAALPTGEWFRLKIGEEAGLSITQKTRPNGGSNGDQIVFIGNEPVWWVKNYLPGEYLEKWARSNGSPALVA